MILMLIRKKFREDLSINGGKIKKKHLLLGLLELFGSVLGGLEATYTPQVTYARLSLDHSSHVTCVYVRPGVCWLLSQSVVS